MWIFLRSERIVMSLLSMVLFHLFSKIAAWGVDKRSVPWRYDENQTNDASKTFKWYRVLLFSWMYSRILWRIFRLFWNTMIMSLCFFSSHWRLTTFILSGLFCCRFSGWRAEARELHVMRAKATQILARMVRRTKGPLWVKESALVCFHMWHRYTAVKVCCN